MKNNKKLWFHAIGVCGKATSNVAKMFKEMGYFVTGSDIQILPPAKDILDNNQINYVEGYDFRHLTKEFWENKLNQKLNISDKPDLGLIVESSSDKNKEYLYAKLHNIEIKPFSQILRDYMVKENSIVVTGTAGKTTSTALITFLLQKLNLNPSYMFGADAVNFDSSIANTNSEWSVLEGDEYYSKILSNGPKFLEYKPKYLLLTNIGWEHLDVYSTEESYLEEFQKLVELVPPDGLIVAKASDKKIDKIIKFAKCKTIRYSYNDSTVWHVSNIGEGNYVIKDQNKKEILDFETNLIGTYNLENICGAVALLTNLIPDLDLNVIKKSIKEFKGAKKRLEMIYDSENLKIIDDFGIAPDRAKNSIKTLRDYFPEYKITAIFEPNSGSRPKDETTFKNIYKEVFSEVTDLIIPEMSTFNADLIDHILMVKFFEEMGFSASHLEINKIKDYLRDKLKSNQKQIFIFFSAYRLNDLAKSIV